MIEALLLGLIGGVIPGPVLAATFTEILQNGFIKSLRIILLAMFTETIVALISLVALTYFKLPQTFFYIISFIGAGVLIWIATSIWKIKKIDTDDKIHFSFAKIASMILANGLVWIFWITVCIPKAVRLGEQLLFGQYIFLVFVEIGWLVSTVVVALIFSNFRKYLSNPKIVPVIFKVFALIFIYFAISMIYNSLIFFIDF